MGNDSNYFQVKGNGELYINCSQRSSSINFDTGTYERNRINLECESNDINLYPEGLDFDSDFAIARGENGRVSVGSSTAIYSSKVYIGECGSMKLLVQCKGRTNGGCQLSELLVVRPYNGTSVYINETGRVTGIGTTAHITFSASWDSGEEKIVVTADASSDPDNDDWSYKVVPIEIQDYSDF